MKDFEWTQERVKEFVRISITRHENGEWLGLPKEIENFKSSEEQKIHFGPVTRCDLVWEEGKAVFRRNDRDGKWLLVEFPKKDFFDLKTFMDEVWQQDKTFEPVKVTLTKESHYRPFEDVMKGAKPLNSEWEIVAIIGNYSNVIYKYKDGMWLNERNCGWGDGGERYGKLDESGCTIHSVKRLSDGEVFSVGDKLDKYKAEIKSFEIRGGLLRIISDAKGDGCSTLKLSWNLSDLKKFPTPSEPHNKLKVTRIGLTPRSNMFTVFINGCVDGLNALSIQQAIEQVLNDDK